MAFANDARGDAGRVDTRRRNPCFRRFAHAWPRLIVLPCWTPRLAGSEQAEAEICDLAVAHQFSGGAFGEQQTRCDALRDERAFARRMAA